MPTKASITTRTDKGSPLSTVEMDSNLTALRDQSIGFADDGSTVLSVDSGNTITIAGAGTVSTAIAGSTLTITGTPGAVSPITFVGDDSTGTAVSVGETFKIAGGTNITTAVSGDVLTVTGPDLTSYITAASSDTLTNKTIDANGTGNAITNLEVADFAGSAIITVSETLASNDSDTALVTAGAIIDYVDAQDANIASDTLTFTNKTIDANGTGNSITNIEVADLAAGVLDTDLTAVSASDDTLASAKAIKAQLDLKISDVVSDTTPQLGGDLDINSQKIVSTSNGTIELEPNGTGNVLADVTGGGTLKVENTHSFTSGFDDIYPGQALTLSDSGGATLTIDQYLQESPAAAAQFFSIYYDNTGTYTYPSGATEGDVANFIGYNFDDETCEWTAQGGDLYITALNHTDYTEKNIHLQSPLASYKEAVETLTSSTTIAVDCSLAQVSRVALGTNTQFTFNNLTEGKSHTLIIVSSGSYTATFDDDTSTAVLFPGGAPTITASGTDVVTVFNTGSEILGNIAQDFQ